MRSLKLVLFCLIVFLGVSSFTSAASLTKTLYVRPDTKGHCTSWPDACELQTALFNANSGDQVWVAEGIYKPTTGLDPLATFQLESGVAIYGGFPAVGGEWIERKPAAYVTSLSGNIGVSGDNSDNSYHVVTGSGVDINAVLDGFTISGGNAHGLGPHNYGGGMYNAGGHPTLTNVTFSGNSTGYGGGMYNYYSGPTLTNVTFSGNTALYSGGGMFNEASSPTLTNITFSGNTALYGGGGRGGGMYNAGSHPTLTNVTFSGNKAYSGGGLYNSRSHPKLTNVTFSNNTVYYYGGGMFNEVSSPTLTNVTFSGNTAGYGGGMFNDSSSPTLTNALLWGNSPDQINGSSAIVSYSDVQGGYTGTNNISDDPLLGILTNNGGFTQTHALLSGSPAIDTANPASCPTTDQRGYPRPIDGDGNGSAICDMGAYEFYFGRLYLPLVSK